MTTYVMDANSRKFNIKLSRLVVGSQILATKLYWVHVNDFCCYCPLSDSIETWFWKLFTTFSLRFCSL